MKTDSSYKNIKSNFSHNKVKDNMTSYESEWDEDLYRKLDRFQNNKLLGGLQEVYDKYYK